MTKSEVSAMSFDDWEDAKRFADIRLGLKRDEDGEEDVEYG